MLTVLYAPLIYKEDKGTWPPSISSTLYYRFQKRLYKIFSKYKNINFIWKVGPRTSNLEDPIRKFKSDNIRYSKRNLKKELKKCDILIVDALSTSVEGAINLNIPVFYISYFDHKNIRTDIFKKWNITLI